MYRNAIAKVRKAALATTALAFFIPLFGCGGAPQYAHQGADVKGVKVTRGLNGPQETDDAVKAFSHFGAIAAAVQSVGPAPVQVPRVTGSTFLPAPVIHVRPTGSGIGALQDGLLNAH